MSDEDAVTTSLVEFQAPDIESFRKLASSLVQEHPQEKSQVTVLETVQGLANFLHQVAKLEANYRTRKRSSNAKKRRT